jgi:hypothetical protein
MDERIRAAVPVRIATATHFMIDNCGRKVLPNAARPKTYGGRHLTPTDSTQPIGILFLLGSSWPGRARRSLFASNDLVVASESFGSIDKATTAETI